MVVVITNIPVQTKVKRFKTGMHVLVCDRLKNNPKYLELPEDYKSNFISNSTSPYKDFSKQISISFHVDIKFNTSYGTLGEKESGELNTGIYMLQTIQIQGKKLIYFLIQVVMT